MKKKQKFVTRLTQLESLEINCLVLCTKQSLNIKAGDSNDDHTPNEWPWQI